MRIGYLLVPIGLLSVATTALVGCGPPFTDVLNAKASPDGRAVAAEVVEARGFAAPVTYGLTLSRPGGDPRSGKVLLVWADDKPLSYRWSSSKVLLVQRPCGARPPSPSEPSGSSSNVPVKLVFGETSDCSAS